MVADPPRGTFPPFSRWRFPQNEPLTSEFLKGFLKIGSLGSRSDPHTQNPEGIERGDLHAAQVKQAEGIVLPENGMVWDSLSRGGDV